jgi:Protein of unknown function (DUF2723)
LIPKTRILGAVSFYWVLANGLLLLFYLPSLLGHVSGGRTAYMDDVGEIQVALNVWGTVHHTGYPLYTMLGNGVVSSLRAIGVDPALAASLNSLLWGLLGLNLIFVLVWRLTQQPSLALMAVVAVGLSRSVWLHNVIAEVYSTTFFYVCLLIFLALYPAAWLTPRRRLYGLALVGGFGVAHHRMIAFLAPGLLYAALPPLLTLPKKQALLALVGAVPLALVGFLPYVYLPLRALAGGVWVYNDPSTWAGLWHEFSGAEANFLLRPPADWPALAADMANTLRVLITEITLPLAALLLLASIWAAWRGNNKRTARILLLASLGYFIFLFVFHRAVMPEAVATPIVTLFAVAASLGLSAVKLPRIAPLLLTGALCLGLWGQQWAFIRELVDDKLGLEAVAQAQRLPQRDAVLMLAWGARHTAVGYSKYVSGENRALQLVDHNADLAPLSAANGGVIYTFADTFYRFPLSWWANQLGRVYLSSVADGVVAVRSQPDTTLPAPPLEIEIANGVWLQAHQICQSKQSVQIRLWWAAKQAPITDLSVFVHLRGPENGAPLAQADRDAPVYGHYPTSLWAVGEIVQEDYLLPLAEGGARVVLGMYAQPTPGQFVNYEAVNLPLSEIPACPS